MKLFKISCRSECGTYFVPYLQDIIIQADSQEHALASAEKWMKENRSFVRPKKNWEIEELKPDSFGVVDCTIDTDY